MLLKKVDKKGRIKLKDYPERKCRRIIREKDLYVLECVRSFGNDYGGSQVSEDTETTYMEIIPERILVKKGHFCGVSMIVSYDSCNGGEDRTVKEVRLLTDGSGTTSARDGFSFSNDDHDRWDYTDYYLVRRPSGEGPMPTEEQ